MLRIFALLPLLLLAACDGGPRFATPQFHAVGAHLPQGAGAVDLEILAHNHTEAPMWIRRIDVELAIADQLIAQGLWDGDRMIDAGTGVVLPLRLPLAEGVNPPANDTAADLRVNTRYARSGLIGILGGETHAFDLPIVLRRADPPRSDPQPP